MKVIRQAAGLAIYVAMVASPAFASDGWEFFHPELVKTFGCRVNSVSTMENGTPVHTDSWEAEAFAIRNSVDGNWEMTIGIFPATNKGRHQAEKTCSKWVDEATKIIRKAQAR